MDVFYSGGQRHNGDVLQATTDYSEWRPMGEQRSRSREQLATPAAPDAYRGGHAKDVSLHVLARAPGAGGDGRWGAAAHEDGVVLPLPTLCCMLRIQPPRGQRPRVCCDAAARVLHAYACSVGPGVGGVRTQHRTRPRARRGATSAAAWAEIQTRSQHRVPRVLLQPGTAGNQEAWMRPRFVTDCKVNNTAPCAAPSCLQPAENMVIDSWSSNILTYRLSAQTSCQFIASSSSNGQRRSPRNWRAERQLQECALNMCGRKT